MKEQDAPYHDTDISLVILPCGEKKKEEALKKEVASKGEKQYPEVQIMRVKFDVEFNLCSDITQEDGDYDRFSDRFYILKDAGDYWHWLAERKGNDWDKPDVTSFTNHHNPQRADILLSLFVRLQKLQ